MELIQTQATTATSTWDNSSVSCLIPPLSPPTPSAPPFGLTLTDDSALLNSSWQNQTDPDSHGPAMGVPPSLAGVLISLIYVTVCVVGLAGNTLVIHVVLRYTRAESVTNLYILNLAIADELFMLGLPFLAVQNALLSWPFGSLMCHMVMTVDAINQFTSIFCLTVMSIDRYLAVVHPIRSCWWRRPHVAKAVNVTMWVISFIVVLPVVVFAGVMKDDGNCSIVWPEPADVWKTSFIIYTSTVGFFCPLLVICLCYLLIIIKVRSAGKRARATSSRRRKSERKVTRMVVVVVAVFVLCWLPFYILNIVNLMVVLPKDFRRLYFFVVVLSYANSCANPILYGFLSDNFKRGFRKALCRSSRRVENERAGTVFHCPTEEWGGNAHRPQNGLRVTDAQEKGREAKGGAEEVMERIEDAVKMTSTCRTVQNSENGEVEGCTMLMSEGGEPERGAPGSSAKAGEMKEKGSSSEQAEAASGPSDKLKTGSSRSLPEDRSAGLEISSL